MCGFPAATHGHEIVLTTCTNRRDITWEDALARRYTLMPKPFVDHAPQLLRSPSWITIAIRAWRSRHHHPGLLAAFRAEHSDAIENTRRENERRQADADTSRRQWQKQRDHAAQAFRERHSPDPR